MSYQPRPFHVLTSLAVLGAVSFSLGFCPLTDPGEPSGTETGEARLAAGAPVVAPAVVPSMTSDLKMTPELKAAGVTELELIGAHDPDVDVWHPDGTVEPALGGRVIMHVSSEPPSLNFATENSASIRWTLRDVHAALLQFSPVSWEYEPNLSVGYDVEDTLLLNGGPGDAWDNIVFGKIVEETASAYVVESGSSHHEMERTEVAKSDVASVERGTVWTFQLRDGVVWHDGHAFDADDVMFSMSIYANPGVDCDEKRYQFEKIKRYEKLGDSVVRFFIDEQYFASIGMFSFDFTVLPGHLYNLADPDHAQHDAAATAEAQAKEVNENRHNIEWVGLGPYRVTKWEQGQYMDAVKFPDYWKKSPEESGYLDTLRWRYIKDDDAAWLALLNDEVDIFYRVKSADFVGEATRTELFTSKCYKALCYVGNVGYTVWNMHRKKLQDPLVRRALAHAFDVAEWIRTNYEGFALWSTATQFWFGPGYDHGMERYEYDLEEAEDLLAEAGWYDRNGNGIVDKDGQDLVIEVLMPAGNKASEKFLQALQDSYRKVGVQVDIAPFEWATMLERMRERDFDAVNLAWTFPTPESDPYQIWHSENGAVGKRSSNNSGMQDDQVDELIALGRRELDDAKRALIWQKLHRRIYELQPYLFGWNVPRKLAFNKKLHGVKLYKFEPGFSLQDLYYEAGTEGTRPLKR
jgi:peptide/nickel transport system substrate-binding protein